MLGSRRSLFFGHALPEFVVGTALVLLFAVTWHILPAVSFRVSFEALVLPVATLLIVSVGYCARMVRVGVIEVLNSEYVHMARLKGMPEHLVVRRHVLPNALVPSFHVFALTIAWMTGGLVVVENLFGYPGVGQAIVGAVESRDIPLVEALRDRGYGLHSGKPRRGYIDDRGQPADPRSRVTATAVPSALRGTLG